MGRAPGDQVVLAVIDRAGLWLNVVKVARSQVRIQRALLEEQLEVQDPQPPLSLVRVG